MPQVPLPTGLPSRIYPQDGVSETADLSGFTLISILFNQELNWQFVATNQDSSSQIFAYFPLVLQTALGVGRKPDYLGLERVYKLISSLV